MAEAVPASEQEVQMQELFALLDKLLRKAEKAKNPDKLHALLKECTVKLKECKTLLKDFERDARADDMPAPQLAQRKKVLADQLNALITRKKEVGQAATKEDLLAGAVVQQEDKLQDMQVQQLIQVGKRDLAATDATLNRAERLVEDTMQTGTQTAAALNDQTQQLNKVVDDLADLEFNVKKASKVIRDITRGLLTDKCIGFLLFACVCGVIAIIVVKVVNPNKSSISEAISTVVNSTSTSPPPPSPPPAGGRRMLRLQTPQAAPDDTPAAATPWALGGDVEVKDDGGGPRPYEQHAARQEEHRGERQSGAERDAHQHQYHHHQDQGIVQTVTPRAGRRILDGARARMAITVRSDARRLRAAHHDGR